MSELDLDRLDHNLRDRIRLLRTISKSSAFSPQEQAEIQQIIQKFMTQLNHITLKLGVIGEFNAGKSTLLNAILGKHVVATSDRPCTPVPIYIEGGSPEGLSIRHDDGSESTADLEAYSRYTTDGEAPAGIHSIHMTVQSALLTDNRITLIDTPGINAINPVHTAITESVLPEMHAAILLMYSKQPGSKSTIEFLKNASSQMGKVFICISKADFLDDGQLTRIVEGLPERLTRLSGVAIDQVHPIHFDENGGGEDFFRFMEELKRFMMSEWYQAISKEVELVLAGYSATISALVLNKLNLEERLFYNFMKDTPVDFSDLAGELLNKVNECLELHFDIDQHRQFATRVGAHCLENIQAQLQQDLQPDKSVMLFFDKRVNEKELRKATKNCSEIFKQMGRIEQEVEERVKAFTASVQDLSVEALRTINDLLDDFRGRVRSEIMGRPDVIQAARRVRLVRWLAACATLSAILLAGALLPQTHAPEWAKYSAYGLTAALLVFPFLVSRKPAESDLSRLAENELKALQCFSVPTFVNPHTGQLTISGINTQGSLWNKERQTSFNQTANSISKSVYYLGDKAAGLEVAAVFAVVNYSIAWFSKPKAKDVFREILGQTEAQIERSTQGAHASFLRLKENIRESAAGYVNSLPDRFSGVLQEAFGHNSRLVDDRKKTLNELEGFLAGLKTESLHEAPSTPTVTQQDLSEPARDEESAILL